MAKTATSKPVSLDHVCQFLVVLPRTEPLVWRRIQVPEGYSFWDLHVAIQDAMGWKDYHLHEFIVVDAKTRRVKRIGIPDDEMPDGPPSLAGWKVPIGRYLTYGTDPVRYRYDFGDDWEHTVEFEELLPADEGAYPRCIGGAGACPPEDVGGTSGYAEFLRTAEFALMIGVSVATLRNWEQGRRTPDGPALALLRVAARNPKAVIQALHAGPKRGAA
jgi:hypothetical protein